MLHTVQITVRRTRENLQAVNDLAHGLRILDWRTVAWTRDEVLIVQFEGPTDERALDLICDVASAIGLVVAPAATDDFRVVGRE
jgi:hypothetical protein